MATSKTAESASKKTTPKKVTAKVTDSKPEKTATKRKKHTTPVVITSEERMHMIEVAAYFIAEKNGFGSNHMHDWLQAEQEIDAKLNA